MSCRVGAVASIVRCRERNRKLMAARLHFDVVHVKQAHNHRVLALSGHSIEQDALASAEDSQ